MRSALRTSAGPNARYADCGSVTASTLYAHLGARAGYQARVDRAVGVGRARPAVEALVARRAGACTARAIGIDRARRTVRREVLAGAAQVWTMVVGLLAGGGAAHRVGPTGGADAERAHAARAFAVAQALLAERARGGRDAHDRHRALGRAGLAVAADLAGHARLAPQLPGGAAHGAEEVDDRADPARAVAGDAAQRGERRRSAVERRHAIAAVLDHRGPHPRDHRVARPALADLEPDPGERRL